MANYRTTATMASMFQQLAVAIIVIPGRLLICNSDRLPIDVRCHGANHHSGDERRYVSIAGLYRVADIFKDCFPHLPTI